jgi:hypothetical protein
MEYELIGADGKTHDRFEDHDEALDAICEEERAQPGITAGWIVQLYDDDGNEVGEPERADTLLATAGLSQTLAFVAVSEGAGVYGAMAPAGSSGMVLPSGPWFRHRPRVAKGTRAPAEAGTPAAR